MQPNMRATAIIKPQGLASVAHATTSPSTGFRVDWTHGGCCVWIVGSVTGATSNDNFMAGMSSLGFRIQMLGRTEFITAGINGADYLQFSAAFPTNGLRMPINVPVNSGDSWTVFVRNVHSSTDFTPDIAFGLAE